MIFHVVYWTMWAWELFVCRVGRGSMNSERTLNIVMGGLALVLLVPSTLLYFAGALGWFVLWGGAIVLTAIEGIARLGWNPIFERLVQEGWQQSYTASLGFSAFMLAAGIGICATWLLLAVGYSGLPMKKVPKLFWLMLGCGWFSATLTLGMIGTAQRLIDQLGFWVLLGLGPLIFSLLIVAWLYWLGRRR